MYKTVDSAKLYVYKVMRLYMIRDGPKDLKWWLPCEQSRKNPAKLGFQREE